jgi:hypothetical protein
MENFLISSVASILFVRIFLALTGYPQLGGDSLHIAHMLWGGLLMLIAITLTLTFLNKEAKRTSSVVGGIGFGIFIDELGKFITHDNNYFFQPTFALLYVIFLLLTFGFKKVTDSIQKDEKEYAMNALEILKEAIYYDLNKKEKQHILEYLEKSDENNQIIQELKVLTQKLNTVPEAKLGKIARLKQVIRNYYLKIIKSVNFVRILIVIFIVGSGTNIVTGVTNILNQSPLSFWDWGLYISLFISGVFILIGLKDLATNRVSAYINFKRAVMVSILLTQFFTFYHQQLAALIPLVTSFTVFLGIQALLEEEHLTQ